MAVDLITVPWDSGRIGARMGAGPMRMVDGGAADRLRAAGPVRETVVGTDPELAAEIATTFELARSTAFAVRTACGHGALPLVLAGNCMMALGVLAALPSTGTGVVWLDAHGDLHTPETTSSGMLDGMALSTILGRCWRGMASEVDGFAPVPEQNVLMIGARDLDAPEREYLERSPVEVLEPSAARDRAELSARLALLASRVQRVYLHVDLDVHDPEEGWANGFQPHGGLRAAEVRDVVRATAARIAIAGASITAYDPSVDRDGAMLAIALGLVELIGEIAANGGRTPPVAEPADHG